MARSPFYVYPSKSIYEYRTYGLHEGWIYGPTGQVFPAGTYSMTIGNPITADVNGDGRQDLIFAPQIFPHGLAHTAAYPTILLGTKSGSLESKPGFTTPPASLGRQQNYRFDVGDINADGFMDIVASAHGAPPIVPGERQTLIYGSPLGITDETNRLPFHDNGSDPVHMARDATLGDIDSDGDLDILFSGKMASGEIGFFLNDSNGLHFTDISDRLPAAVGDPYAYTDGQVPFQASIELADLNGDNAADIVAPYYRGGEMNGFIGLNDGHGQFSESAVMQLPQGIYGTNTKNDDIAVVDIDGDGFKDIILSQGRFEPYYVGRQLQVIKNYGGTEFKDESWRIQGDQDRAGSKGGAEGTIYIIDFDRDGDPDILDSSYAHAGNIGTRLFLNDGTGRFTKAPDSMLPTVPKNWGGETPSLIPIDLGNKHGFDFVYFSVGGDGKTYSSLKAHLIKAQGLTLTGNDKSNKLSGGSGNDTLSGKGGNDNLSGGARDDRLKGGLNFDQLTGGSGRDRFMFDTNDTGPSKSTADRINDFKGLEGDKIDLAAIDANINAKGNQKFSFIGLKKFTKAGQVRYEKTATETYISFNTDSDRSAEGGIRLKGKMDLTKDWFVL
jgi:Ca2+-binding RTX toxin-like protein